MRIQSEEIMKSLFEAFMKDDVHLPVDWSERVNTAQGRARQVADYLAGMTDGYAQAKFDGLNR